MENSKAGHEQTLMDDLFPHAARLTAKAALQELIRRKREELEGYEALLPIIPDDLTPEQDTALWRMIINLRG